MKQAIEFSSHVQQHLLVTARRKNNQAYFIYIEQGAALIRLGKNEYLVGKGMGFWIPFDCLHALTVLPNSHFYRVNFSIRSRAPLPTEAGFFNLPPLLHALVEQLASFEEQDYDWSGPFGRLLQVTRDQIEAIQVTTSSLCPGLNKPEQQVLSTLLQGNLEDPKLFSNKIQNIAGFSVQEIQAILTCREAIRLSRSGKKAPAIAETLKLSLDELNALVEVIAGGEL